MFLYCIAHTTKKRNNTTALFIRDRLTLKHCSDWIRTRPALILIGSFLSFRGTETCSRLSALGHTASCRHWAAFVAWRRQNHQKVGNDACFRECIIMRFISSWRHICLHSLKLCRPRQQFQMSTKSANVDKRLSTSTNACRHRQTSVDIDKRLSISTNACRHRQILSISTNFVDIDKRLSTSTDACRHRQTPVCRHRDRVKATHSN